jgi:hypothetical protein
MEFGVRVCEARWFHTWRCDAFDLSISGVVIDDFARSISDKNSLCATFTTVNGRDGAGLCATAGAECD